MGKQTWVVTGCSSGIGKEITLGILPFRILSVNRVDWFDLSTAALARGDSVIATCRGSASRLDDLVKAGAKARVLDVGSPPEKLTEWVQTLLEDADVKEDGIDVLVNNADYVQRGTAEELRWVHNRMKSWAFLSVLQLSGMAKPIQ
jgi:NAD(P)-dependent dehydrogenase (short-subunit alcohol dehydrogenase family)